MKLGIALGGGGARGFAHLGVLKALRDEGIEFDVVAGTSIGALVGAVYAAGSLDELEDTARSISLKDIPLLMSPAWSKKGFFSGKSALELLNELIGCDLIEELPKRFAAVSADLKSGETVVFTEGNVHQAVRASISIPAVFTPVVIDDRILVDGGLVEPVPVEICKSLGADVVVAVDLFGQSLDCEQGAALSDLNERRMLPSSISTALGYLNSISNKLQLTEWLGGDSDDPHRAVNIIDIVEGTLAVSQRLLTAYRLCEHPPDLLIQPKVTDVGLLDFHRGDPVMEIGQTVARDSLPEIKRLLARENADS